MTIMRQDFQQNQEECSPLLLTQSGAVQAAQEDSLIQGNPLVLSVQRRIQKYNRTLLGAVLGTGLAVWGVVLLATGLTQTGHPLVSVSLVLAVLSGVAVALTRPRVGLLKAKEDIKKVAQFEDFEALGTMIEMLNLEKEISVAHAMTGVTNLLSRIQPEQAWALSARHRTTLRHLLNRNIEVTLYRDLTNLFGPISLENEANRRAINLRVAIMKGFSRVGTEAEIPALERWATLEPKSEAQAVLKSTAMECLPILRERVAQTADKNTLLRASQANEGDANTLLRPSRETVDPTEQLLRPQETP